MTRKEKKAYLSQYLVCVDEIEILQQNIQELDSRTKRITSTFSGMPHSKAHKGFEDAADKMIDLKQKLSDKVTESVQKMKEVESVIDNVQDTTQRIILSERYICGYKFDKIAVDCAYHVRHIHKLHNKALDSLDL